MKVSYKQVTAPDSKKIKLPHRFSQKHIRGGAYIGVLKQLPPSPPFLIFPEGGNKHVSK